MTYHAPTRNEIFGALFGLTANLDLGSAGAFVSRSRKFKHWVKVPNNEQPALFQVEPMDRSTAKTRMPAARRFQVVWTVYFNSDPSDPEDIPAVKMNDIIDALENCLKEPFNQQTLGGRVAHTFIDGEIIKVDGADDGQGMIVIPITILGP